jgi:hypothetical protein
MLSQADLKVISTVFGKTSDEISSAISQEGEVSLDLRLNGRVISQEDEKTLKDTVRNAGVEIGYKQIAKELEFDLSADDKDAKVIAEKLKTSITATLEEKYKNPQPGEREKELEEKLQAEKLKYDKLFETHESTLGQIQEKEKAYTGLQKEIKTKERNNSILKTFPEKMKMDRNDALLIFTNTFEFDEVEGQQVIKRKGEIVTDAVGKPEKLENIVPSFVEEKNWLKGSGMNGGDRGAGGGKKGGLKPEEAHKYVTEKLGAGKETTPEGIKLFNELIAKTE